MNDISKLFFPFDARLQIGQIVILALFRTANLELEYARIVPPKKKNIKDTLPEKNMEKLQINPSR